MSKIIRRIEREAGVSKLSEILVENVKLTDLQSLLLEVYRRRVEQRYPHDVISDYASNSFTRPSRCDPVQLLEWDRIAFSHLPDGFHAVELSPVSPLGSVSCLAPISQDWVLTTIRNTEVVADPTNQLALECALRRQELIRSEHTKTRPVHLACSHRVVRGQRYRSPEDRQHFRLFSLCSAGRDSGDLRFELNAMTQHIRFYLLSLKEYLGEDISLRVSFINLTPESHDDALFHPSLETLTKEFKDLDVRLQRTQTEMTNYYHDLRFHVSARSIKGPEVTLVDGGDTDWTQKLLNNAKERLITSGLGSERLCEKFMSIHRS